MKLGDANYDSTVEQKRTELRGHKVTTMTEAETQAEIERIQDGAKSSFEGEITLEVASGQKIVTTLSPSGEVIGSHLVGYITKSGRVMKSKPGRKAGSRNKPKEAQ